MIIQLDTDRKPQGQELVMLRALLEHWFGDDASPWTDRPSVPVAEDEPTEDDDPVGDAVALATKLVDEDRIAEVRDRLKAAGAERVSVMTEEQARKFLA